MVPVDRSFLESNNAIQTTLHYALAALVIGSIVLSGVYIFAVDPKVQSRLDTCTSLPVWQHEGSIIRDSIERNWKLIHQQPIITDNLRNIRTT